MNDGHRQWQKTSLINYLYLLNEPTLIRVPRSSRERGDLSSLSNGVGIRLINGGTERWFLLHKKAIVCPNHLSTARQAEDRDGKASLRQSSGASRCVAPSLSLQMPTWGVHISILLHQLTNFPEHLYIMQSYALWAPSQVANKKFYSCSHALSNGNTALRCS